MTPTDLADCPAHELLALYRSGQASPVEATRAVLARIDRLNPVLRAFTHVAHEEALAAAEAGDLGPAQRLLAVLRDPYAETPENEPYRGGPPCGTGPYRTFCGT